MRPSSLVGGLALVLIAAAAYATTAPPRAPRVIVSQQQDTMAVRATWRTPCDMRGCADSARVTWRIGGQPAIVRTTTRTEDTQRFRAPAYGDSINVTVSIEAIRRNQIGAARSVSQWVKRLDAPPPPVDSVRVDTVRVDSMRVTAYHPRTGERYPVPIVVAEGDSVLWVARLYFRPGFTRRPTDRNQWDAVPLREELGGVVTIRPVDAMGDSAMFVAINCGCRESGDFTNRPHLTPVGWRKRSPSGAWVPVTPVTTAAPQPALNPFAVRGS